MYFIVKYSFLKHILLLLTTVYKYKEQGFSHNFLIDLS